MLTIFTTPKAFRGRFDTIQRNAIKSWTRLSPAPEIILLGDDPGVKEVADEYGCRHVPRVPVNRFGTPLLSGIFSKAQQHASNNLMCYVNSDIILLGEFMSTITRTLSAGGNGSALLVGRKTSLEIDTRLEFEQPGWEKTFRARACAEGKYVTYDSDFFVFPKGMFADIPNFAIGRCYWTQWLMYSTCRKGIPMVDVSRVLLSVESRHDYSHAVSTGGDKRLSGAEFNDNRRLFAGCKYFTTLDAPFVMTETGPVKRPWQNSILSVFVRAEYYVYFLLKATWYPYSLPLVVTLRWTMRVAKLLLASVRLPSRMRS